MLLKGQPRGQGSGGISTTTTRMLSPQGLVNGRPSPRQPTPSPVKRVEQAPCGITLSPRTAAAAGFSQILDLDMSWGLDDDDDDDEELRLSRNRGSQRTPSPAKSRHAPNAFQLSPRTAAAAGLSQVIDMTWDDDEPSPVQPTAQASAPREPVPPRQTIAMQLSPRTAAAAGFPEVMDLGFWDDIDDDDDPVLSPPQRCRDMPPPPVHDFKTSLRVPSQQSPESADTPLTSEPTPFPVRRRQLASSPPLESPGSTSRPLQRLRRRPPSESPVSTSRPLRRLRHRPPSSPVESSRARPAPRQPRALPRRAGDDRARRTRAETALLDLDVGVSGSESSDEGSGSEDESDRRFAGDFAPTQAVRGYNQGAVYAAGMSTQACARNGLVFADDRDTRTVNFLAKARRAVLVSDDEDVAGKSENEYELGSFVCDDSDVAFTYRSLWK